jgi:hypothetical protein
MEGHRFRVLPLLPRTLQPLSPSPPPWIWLLVTREIQRGGSHAIGRWLSNCQLSSSIGWFFESNECLFSHVISLVWSRVSEDLRRLPRPSPSRISPDNVQKSGNQMIYWTTTALLPPHVVQRLLPSSSSSDLRLPFPSFLVSYSLWPRLLHHRATTHHRSNPPPPRPPLQSAVVMMRGWVLLF